MALSAVHIRTCNQMDPWMAVEAVHACLHKKSMKKTNYGRFDVLIYYTYFDSIPTKPLYFFGIRAALTDTRRIFRVRRLHRSFRWIVGGLTHSPLSASKESESPAAQIIWARYGPAYAVMSYPE